MKKLILFLYFVPYLSYSQVIIKADLIQKSDSKNTIENLFDLSIGSFVNNNLIIGLTNEDAIADYIQDGFNPIQDSFVVSDFQLFFKYFYDKRSFFILKIPSSSDVIDMSIFERVRVGGGYIFHSKDNFDFDISYDVLLSPNRNGWNKGKLSIGISIDASEIFPKVPFDSNLLQKFSDWVNTPLSNGYRESMF
jgi:hypothetical protein